MYEHRTGKGLKAESLLNVTIDVIKRGQIELNSCDLDSRIKNMMISIYCSRMSWVLGTKARDTTGNTQNDYLFLLPDI